MKTHKETDMVTEKEQEYLAAALRQQRAQLTGMIEEMERERLQRGAVEWRLKAVELSLRRLREAA